ncbi:MAG: radical SAM protein [Pseudomonadota bacterium]
MIAPPRIALIHARVDHNAVPPLGLLSMATVLARAGFPARVWDPLPRDERFLDEIAAFEPDLVGVSVLTAEFCRAGAILAALRARLPGAPQLIGGAHVSALPRESLEALGADLAVVGEGEETLLALVQGFATEGALPTGLPGTVTREVEGPPPEPIADLDTLPVPDRALLAGDYGWYLAPPGVLRGLWRRGTTTIMAGRGCPHRCVFCASHVVGGRVPRLHSVPLVLEELRRLRARHGLTGAWFLDDDLAARPAWLGELCQALGPLGLAWSCQARIDRLDPPLLREMAASGCVQVELGLESGSDRVLRSLRKGLDVGRVEERVAAIRRVGIRVMVNFMIGAPGEMVEDIQATFALARRLRPDFVEFNVCTPYPGSDLYAQAVREGTLARGALDFDEHWSEHFTESPVLAGGLPGHELMRWRARMQNTFLLSNYRHIAAGLLRSPRAQARLGTSLARAVRREPGAFLEALRQRQLDPVLWRAYAAWSGSWRGAA